MVQLSLLNSTTSVYFLIVFEIFLLFSTLDISVHVLNTNNAIKIWLSLIQNLLRVSILHNKRRRLFIWRTALYIHTVQFALILLKSQSDTLIRSELSRDIT